MSDQSTKDDKRMEAFLVELYELFIKHDMMVSGCGCCDSPFALFWDDKDDPKKYPSYGPAGAEALDRFPCDGDLATQFKRLEEEGKIKR